MSILLNIEASEFKLIVCDSEVFSLADRISDISASILYISEDKHCLEYACCYYEKKEQASWERV